MHLAGTEVVAISTSKLHTESGNVPADGGIGGNASNSTAWTYGDEQNPLIGKVKPYKSEHPDVSGSCQ